MKVSHFFVSHSLTFQIGNQIRDHDRSREILLGYKGRRILIKNLFLFDKIIDNTEGILYNGICLEKINFEISVVRDRKREVYFYETIGKRSLRYGNRDQDQGASAEE